MEMNKADRNENGVETKKNSRKGSIVDVAAIVRKTGLIEEGDCLLAGVSGGADSVCLFFALKEAAESFGAKLSVVHIEHGLRGEASRQDAAFVQSICEEYGIPFFMKAVDVRAHTSTHVSEEEAARLLRREAYREAAAHFYGTGAVKLALAHNAEDQAETVLMNLIRGTGIRGLCGMRQKGPMESSEEKGPAITVIRPLLTVSRKDIEAWLDDRGQPYCTDATNQEEIYTRNRIRHRILPELSQINPQAVAHIGQAAAALREIEEEMEGQAAAAASEVIINSKLNRALTAALPRETQNRIIKAWIYKQNGTVKNISSTHLTALRMLLCGHNGAKADVPGRFRAKAEGDYLIWEEKSGRNAPKR